MFVFDPAVMRGEYVKRILDCIVECFCERAIEFDTWWPAKSEVWRHAETHPREIEIDTNIAELDSGRNLATKEFDTTC
jgi:hypothetical protein